MTITVVCDILNDAHNGTNITTMNLINYLRSKGHNVRILCCDKSKAGQKDYYICPTMKYGKPIDYLINKAGILSANAKKGKDVIAQAIKGADIVHLMLPFNLCEGAWKEARKQNVPVTCGCHLLPENFWTYIYLNWCRPLSAFLYRFWYRKVFKHTDYIQYPTELIKTRYQKFVGPTTGEVISNGIPPHISRRFISKPTDIWDKIVILSVGRYGRDKNQATLIKAIKHSKYKDKIQLILAGSGWLGKKYERLSKSLPIKPIMKSYDRKEIEEVINYSDICVHPAIVEAEGISVLEQISCGKLVIVSDSKYSATKNFAVDERCIFKAKDYKDLAAKIDFWIENKQEKEKIEDKYYDSSKMYKLDYCMDKMEKMLTRIVNEKK